LTNGESRADVVLGFSQSVEYQSKTSVAAESYAEGLEPATWSGAVYRLYQATLDRDPSGSDFGNWTAALAGGQSLQSVAEGLVASQEFQNTYGALDNTAFVTLLYVNVLNRQPDVGGLANWVARLTGGESRAQVVLGFSESTEFKNGTAGALTAYMQALGGGDRIEGGQGDDVISGGLYADTFVFGPNDGSDRLVDFEPWDRVDLTQMGYASTAEALTHASQSGANVVFAHQGTNMVFEDTTLSDFGNALLV
jgi:Ca2+-binding RTX toxin-like protein